MLDNNIYDIFSLEKISFFPLAIGYQILLCLILIVIVSTAFYKLYARKSWRFLLKKELALLCSEDSINVKDLYDLIKKILLQRFSRAEVANLTNEQLLLFLDKISQNFSWSKDANFFLGIFRNKEVFIKKDNSQILIKQIKKLING